MRNFESILEQIYIRSPLQKKKLIKILAKRDDKFFQEAEKFATDYTNYLKSLDIPLDYAIEAYLKLCGDMMKSQIDFIKTGQYHKGKDIDDLKCVYRDEREMKSYMIGLALSQFLWESHYEMFSFFAAYIARNKQQIRSYLDIGPGHGLFLKKARDYLDENTRICIVDISPISINITKSIIGYFKPNNTNINYHNLDVLEMNSSEKFDFITMGEVLEHVSNPEMLLRKLRDLLGPKGATFVSTCVNCPALDHVYHFKTVDQIRLMLQSAGFNIAKELVLPVENLSWEEIVNRKVTINYCSILERK